MVDELLVAVNVLRCAEVGGREDLRLRRNLDVGARADPLVPLRERELGDAVVERDEHSRARAVQRDDGSDLVAASRADEAGALVPDANHRAHRPVVVHNRRAVERVPANDVLATRLDALDDRLLLGRRLLHELRVLAGLPHEVVGDHVDAELHVAKRVRAVRDRHQVVAQCDRDLHARLHLLLHERAQLHVRHGRGKHLVEGVILVLLLLARVKRRVRRAVPLSRHAHRRGARRHVRARCGAHVEAARRRCEQDCGERDESVHGGTQV
mmetsp:Transcript_17190/g.53440  ORF Transcript_17190/g.53440 Transcript_17190/m.53440 type:complete len:268 (+) Transcript_17190:1064-1867(+)